MLKLTRISLLIYLLTTLVVISCLDEKKREFSNQWLLNANIDLTETQRLAQENNFKIVKSFSLNNKNYHLVEPDHHKLNKKRSIDSSALSETIETVLKRSEQQILAHPNVNLFEREKILKRNKRDYMPNTQTDMEKNNQLNKKKLQQSLLERIHREYFMRSELNDHLKRALIETGSLDPMWPEMWYLNRNLGESDLPDMNVSGAWSQGYSGRGVSVTFLDDGLEHDHPDIKQNYDAKASDDINGNDDDPMPRYDDSNENKHGTRCAGEVAAAANNSICSVGVAFNAGIGGIRMLDGDVTDSVEARSLSFNRDHIDIYSASWGPDDNGEVVDGPGVLARQAFVEGATLGRKGLGSIFVWASGNGGRFGDSCSCDGYANSIYTLSISSTSENSEKPWYLEECTSTLATTYSSGDERMHEREVVTTDLRHQCTTKHTGTSAAAPIAAGIIALALEANSKLTWRDVMYLVVLTSRPKAIKSNNYIVNKRGFLVSSRYGFGLMDAGRMVDMAKKWQNVPILRSCQTLNSNFRINTVQKIDAIEATLTTDACYNSENEVNFIEQVEIVVSIQAPVRGNLEIFLTSPMGTSALILPKRQKDQSPDGFKRWSFMSVQLWGEMPRGEWKLVVSSADHMVRLEDFSLVIHGTKEKPIEYENLLNMKTVTCNYECVHIEGLNCGPTEYDCFKCAHYSLEVEPKKTKCVSYCPSGYFANDQSKKCVKCDSACLECKGNSSLDCVKCNHNKVLSVNTNTCESNCLDGYLLNSRYECEKCSSECRTCHLAPNICTSCSDDDFKLINNVCISSNQNQCESGAYYDEGLAECRLCDITCAECSSNTADNCTRCLTKRPFLKNGTCVASCAEGFYPDESTNICLKCNQNCDKCISITNCISCQAGFKLNDKNECVSSVLEENQCEKNCLECYAISQTPNKKLCLTCKNGLGMLDGGCFDSAPISGLYLAEVKTNRGLKHEFKQCRQACLSCSDESSCSKCESGYSLINNECFKKCDPGFYSNQNGGCTRCSYPCAKCTNETNCLTCETNMSVLNGKCIEQCPLGFYTQNSVCYPCYPTCLSCNGPGKANCLTCDDGFKQVNTECQSQCADGTYFDKLSKECSICNTNNCSSCVRTASTCIRCFSPLVLDITTFTCKQCCSRSIHGKLKANSCCNCPEISTGYCSIQEDSSKDSASSIFGISVKKETTNKLGLFFSLVFVFLSIGLLVYAVLKLRKTFRINNTKYATVEYRPLNKT